MTELAAPLKVLYCAKCGNPPEYCSFGPDFKTHCKPWLVKSHPDVAAKLGYIAAAAPSAASTAGAADEGDDSKPAASAAAGGPPPTAPWSTSERLTKFYEKYVPSKLADVPSLLAKYSGKEEKLFIALTTKYGPEPLDPYLAAKWGLTEDNDSGDESGSDEDAVDNHTEADEATRQLSGMRLAQQAAAKKVGAIEEGEEGQGEGEEGEEEESTGKARGVAVKSVKKVATRVIIQKLSRQKKKAVTVVIGMETVPDMKMKEAAKAFAKRFAGSSSVKKDASGREEIIIQGDHQEECARMIVEKFKVSKKDVFLDIDGEFVGVV
jgi:density-regulated protein DRP1